MHGFNSWFSTLKPGERLRLFFAGLLLVAVAWYLFNSESPTEQLVTLPESASPEVEASISAIYVHVAGEVRNPGLYELAAGSRVADALALAGGFIETANTQTLNLARILIDGEQVLVPSVAAANSSTVPSLVSLNTATVEELDELPGIGPALANRIIDWRNQFGGFERLQDLLEISGIGEKLFTELLPLISL